MTAKGTSKFWCKVLGSCESICFLVCCVLKFGSRRMPLQLDKSCAYPQLQGPSPFRQLYFVCVGGVIFLCAGFLLGLLSCSRRVLVLQTWWISLMRRATASTWISTSVTFTTSTSREWRYASFCCVWQWQCSHVSSCVNMSAAIIQTFLSEFQVNS